MTETEPTEPPTLRDRALDAVKQAINKLGMWLPPAGREAAVDAVLGLANTDSDLAWTREMLLAAQAEATAEATRADKAEAALALLHASEEEPTSPRLSGPTPAEWLWSWNRATPEQRLEKAAEIIDAGARAGTCFQMAHEKTIQRLRAELGRPTA